MTRHARIREWELSEAGDRVQKRDRIALEFVERGRVQIDRARNDIGTARRRANADIAQIEPEASVQTCNGVRDHADHACRAERKGERHGVGEQRHARR